MQASTPCRFYALPDFMVLILMSHNVILSHHFDRCLLYQIDFLAPRLYGIDFEVTQCNPQPPFLQVPFV
jgi:hypothetical protein